MPREFEIRREVELPATAEQVWAAIATGDGTASWMFPTGEGAPSRVGEVWAGHTVTVFDPPRHIAVRADGPDGVFNALEYIIEARDGGTALLRYVHSGILTDDWDNQYDAATLHTSFYLHTLGQYLQYFQGREGDLRDGRGARCLGDDRRVRRAPPGARADRLRRSG